MKAADFRAGSDGGSSRHGRSSAHLYGRVVLAKVMKMPDAVRDVLLNAYLAFMIPPESPRLSSTAIPGGDALPKNSEILRAQSLSYASSSMYVLGEPFDSQHAARQLLCLCYQLRAKGARHLF